MIASTGPHRLTNRINGPPQGADGAGACLPLRVRHAFPCARRAAQPRKARAHPPCLARARPRASSSSRPPRPPREHRHPVLLFCCWCCCCAPPAALGLCTPVDRARLPPCTQTCRLSPPLLPAAACGASGKHSGRAGRDLGGSSERGCRAGARSGARDACKDRRVTARVRDTAYPTPDTSRLRFRLWSLEVPQRRVAVDPNVALSAIRPTSLP